MTKRFYSKSQASPSFILDRAAHEHFSTFTTEHSPRLGQKGKSIVQGSLGLVYHLVCRNTEKDGAGFTSDHSGDFDIARVKVSRDQISVNVPTGGRNENLDILHPLR